MSNKSEIVNILKSFNGVKLQARSALFKNKVPSIDHDNFWLLPLENQVEVMVEEFKTFARWSGEREARNMIAKVIYCLWDDKIN